MEILGFKLTPDMIGSTVIIIAIVYGIGKYAESSTNAKSGLVGLFVVGAFIFAAVSKFIS